MCLSVVLLECLSNNNIAFISQASWGRLEMKPIRPNIKGQTKRKGKEKRKEKRGKDQQKTRDG